VLIFRYTIRHECLDFDYLEVLTAFEDLKKELNRFF